MALVAGPFPYTAETFVTAHTPYIVDDGKLLSLLKHCIYTVAYILCLHILPHVESTEVIRLYCLMGFGAKSGGPRYLRALGPPNPPPPRDQREWVFEVREVKSEIKKLSLNLKFGSDIEQRVW